MLVSAYQTPLSEIHLEHAALTPAVDVETDDDESEPEDVELYEEDSEAENPDEPDPVSDFDNIQYRRRLHCHFADSLSIWPSYSTCVLA